MNIYTDYVFPDKLISPITGYQCKRVTRQNIEQFGFNTKDELLINFPDFPMQCEEISRKNSKLPPRTTDNKRVYLSNPKICPICNKEIPYHKRKNTYCSRRCNGINHNRNFSTASRSDKLKKYYSLNPKRKSGIKVKKRTCSNCGILFYTNRYNKLCSQMCLKIVQSMNGRKNSAKNIRRSKDEIRLFEYCSSVYASLANYIIKDGWDADIVLPEFKIAILWNGPWHYKEMGIKGHSLRQVRTRDYLKIKLFEDEGWKVLVYEDCNHTPETAFKDIQDLVASMGTAPI